MPACLSFADSLACLQIYRVAIYVEQGPATQHIRQLASQGFFKDKSPTHVCSAILQGKFRKMIFARCAALLTLAQEPGIAALQSSNLLLAGAD